MDVGTVPRPAPVGGCRGRGLPQLKVASDAELVAFIRDGDPAAFEAIFDRYQREILAYCQRLLGDRHEAEDALQHTFLSAYSSIIASDQELDLRPWLYAIARNRCFSLMRGRREVAVPEVEHGHGEEPGVLVARREALRELVFDVSRLPADQRAALVMSSLGAHTHDEIAGVLEVPRSKVKALVFQARESLVASRSAREIDCAEIRRQLHTVRGAALRRGALRRHLRDCEGCREYRSRLRPPVARVAGVLPAGPWLALRAALSRSSVGTTASSGGAGTATAVKLGALKPLVGALAAVLSAASAVVAVHSIAAHHPTSRPAAVTGHSPAAASPASAAPRAVHRRAPASAARAASASHANRTVPSHGPYSPRAVHRSVAHRRALGTATSITVARRAPVSQPRGAHRVQRVKSTPPATPPSAPATPPATPRTGSPIVVPNVPVTVPSAPRVLHVTPPALPPLLPPVPRSLPLPPPLPLPGAVTGLLHKIGL